MRVPPPLVCLGAIGMGVLLQHFAVPLDLPGTGLLRAAAAGFVSACALALLGGALLAFLRTGQNPKPWTPTPECIASGVYRWTRNPMYVGLALLQVALGIGLANGWLLVLAPITLALIHRTAVRHEEAYLERKFGESYLAYKRSVRRWL